MDERQKAQEPAGQRTEDIPGLVAQYHVVNGSLLGISSAKQEEDVCSFITNH